MCKILWARRLGKGGKGWTKSGTRARAVADRWSGRPTALRPAVADRGSPGTGDRRSAACHGSQHVQAAMVDVEPFFFTFFPKKKVTFFLVFFQALACSKGLDFLRGCVHSIPFFEVCPYTWKC
jgi:hypothetical protein